MSVPENRLRRRALIGGGGLLLASVAGQARSQPTTLGWPSRPIRLVVPFAPGGANDVAARLLGNRLGETLGQPAVVENRAGANGIVGLQAVAQAPADGYTLVVASAGPIAVNPALYPSLPYDPERSFAPITNLAMLPLLLVVNPAVPAADTAALVALARAKPGTLAYASPGTGNSGHLAGELFDSVAGVRTVHVPYRGNGPAVTDLLSGQVPMMWSSVPPVIDHVRTGRLRVLCVGSARRLELDAGRGDRGGVRRSARLRGVLLGGSPRPGRNTSHGGRAAERRVPDVPGRPHRPRRHGGAGHDCRSHHA